MIGNIETVYTSDRGATKRRYNLPEMNKAEGRRDEK